MPRESLDAVEWLFGRFVVHFGAARMAAHWSGANSDDVKRYWARRLQHVDRRAVGYALQNLPEHPPTIDQFLAICRRVPKPPFQALPAPVISEESKAKRRESLQKLKKLFGVSTDPQQAEA